MIMASPYSALFERIELKNPFVPDSVSPPDDLRPIDFAIGIPDFSILPREEYVRAFDELMRSEHASEALSYSAYAGTERLRHLIAARRNVDPENVLITNGAMSGIFLSTASLVNPGDTVLTENPTFPYALQTFKLAGANIETVPLSDEGIDVEALESKLRSGKRYAALYIIPDFQNPTGTAYSRDNKRSVVALAEKYGIVIIADNPYRDLWFHDEPSEFPQEERVASDGGHLIEIGTFSKLLGPGWRVGWVIADRERIRKMSSYRVNVDSHTSGIAQHTVAFLLENAEWFDRLIEDERTRYAHKAELLYDALTNAFWDGITITKPSGGYFLWSAFDESLNPNSSDHIKALRRANVNLVAGDVFYPFDRGSRSVRFAFTRLSDDEILEGAHRIAKALTVGA